VPEPVPVESDVVYRVCQNCNCSIGCVIIVNCDYTGWTNNYYLGSVACGKTSLLFWQKMFHSNDVLLNIQIIPSLIVGSKNKQM